MNLGCLFAREANPVTTAGSVGGNLTPRRFTEYGGDRRARHVDRVVAADNEAWTHEATPRVGTPVFRVSLATIERAAIQCTQFRPKRSERFYLLPATLCDSVQDEALSIATLPPPDRLRLRHAVVPGIRIVTSSNGGADVRTLVR